MGHQVSPSRTQWMHKEGIGIRAVCPSQTGERNQEFAAKARAAKASCTSQAESRAPHPSGAEPRCPPPRGPVPAPQAALRRSG